LRGAGRVIGLKSAPRRSFTGRPSSFSTNARSKTDVKATKYRKERDDGCEAEA
jgi:hypothetical protein